MKQILPANRTVFGLCGEQERKEGDSYRLSTCCVSAECADGTLLYHTLTGELLLLSPGEEQNDALIRKRFLVPQEFRDNQFTDEIRRIAGMMRPGKGNRTVFTVLTTTDCNARCYYCYEKGIQRTPMTEEIARAAAEYIARVSRGERVKLRWFGGEPLYNRKAIDEICGVLARKGIAFESSMISNGFYLDEETARAAAEKWNLKKVQITVDGTEKIYNRTKAYIDKEDNPYRRVMNNIRTALEAGIHVTIRLNMDAGNAADLLTLSDDLAEKFQGYGNLDVYVAVLHEFAGKIIAHETQTQKEKDYLAIREKLRLSGLLRQEELSSSLRENRCIADSDASETILPDGRVGRCEHYSESMITGSIFAEERDAAVTKRWKEALSDPACSSCALYPRCRKLALCEWNKDGCAELDRRIGVMEIREQIQKAYQEWKEDRT